MAVTEGVRERREIKKGRQSDETEIERPSVKEGKPYMLMRPKALATELMRMIAANSGQR